MSAPLDEKPRGFYRDALGRLAENRAAVVSFFVLAALVLGCVVVPMLSQHRYDQTDLKLGPVPPSSAHLLGTDTLGRDLMARLFFGGRISFTVGVVATLVSIVIGTLWGAVAGYAGGKIDALMMRAVDVLYAFPFLIFVILLKVFFANDKTVFYRMFKAVLRVVVAHPDDPSYAPVFQIVFVFFALGAMSWLTTARIVRGQVIALRSMPFVEASRSIGAGHAWIILRHLVPNAAGPVIAYATLTIPDVMMTEAFLSFLGLGTQEPLSSWGLLAALGAETMDLYPWQLISPALALAITLLAFNYLGDGLRDALDPKMARKTP